jgi:hypothetical protein
MILACVLEEHQSKIAGVNWLGHVIILLSSRLPRLIKVWHSSSAPVLPGQKNRRP